MKSLRNTDRDLSPFTIQCLGPRFVVIIFSAMLSIKDFQDNQKLGKN